MGSKVAVIDNYDSFTYNLVQLVEEITGTPADVYRNDTVDIERLQDYEYLILSPGPGIPEEAGLLKPIIERYSSSKKILGVCLGQQAIGEVFGCQLKNLQDVFHGVQTEMMLTSDPGEILQNIDTTFLAGRYHSWVIDKTTISDDLQVTCTDEYDEIMGIRHREYQVYGVQFHPESILTPEGKIMLQNFLNI